MQSANNKILVSCNLEQKDFAEIGGNMLKIANSYNPNFREKSPVIAKAEETNGEITKGDILICHHNHFYGSSPFWLVDDLFSIPCNKTIFAIIDKEGNPKPVNGNIIGERLYQDTKIEQPPEFRKHYIDRVKVLIAGYGYAKGQLIFTKPYAPYQICYTLNMIERRITKVDKDMVIGQEN